MESKQGQHTHRQVRAHQKKQAEDQHQKASGIVLPAGALDNTSDTPDTVDALSPASYAQASQAREDAMRELAIFRQYVELAPDGVLITNTAGVIELVNRQMETLFGYPRGELIGQPVELLIPERFRARHPGYRQHYMAHPHTRPMGAGLDLFGLRADGSEFPVEISLSPIEVDGTLKVIGAVRDVTDRKRAEQALRAAERDSAVRAGELEATFNAITDAVVIFDCAGNILRANALAEQVFGVTARTEHSGPALDARLTVVPPRDQQGRPLPRDAWAHQRLLRGEILTSATAPDLVFTTPGGQSIVLNVAGAPIYDQAGNIMGAVLVGRDVTMQRRLERRTREALDALLAMAEVLVQLPTEPGIAASAALTFASEQLVELARRVLGCRSVSLATLDAATERLHPQAVVGLTPEQERHWRRATQDARLRDQLPDASLLVALQQGEAVIVDITRPPFSTRADLQGEQARLVVPMRIGERLVGVVEVGYDNALPILGPEGEQDAARDMSLALTVGKLAALVIEWDQLLAERQAHVEAEARRALLQRVIDELPSGVYLVQGRDARLVLANRAAEAVWGTAWPEGQPMTAFLAASGTRILGVDGRVLTPDLLATLHTVRTGEAVRHHQEIIRQPNGTVQPVLLNAVALDLRLLGLSPTKTAGEDGAGRDDERATATADGTGEFGALVVLQNMTALKEAERLKDEFITIAAHELKTPMAAVKGYAEMLIRSQQRSNATTLAEWQIEALDAIDEATDRLAQLTEDLLDVTRLQAGRLNLHCEPHDLVALARRVARRLQVMTTYHVLHVEANEEYVVANIDIPRIEQVLTNLVNNAIKYSPNGGEIRLCVSADHHAGMAEVSVHDQGIGIPTDQQARIFGRFARSENAQRLGITGTGLGLYLSRELVERHDGRIWFSSTEGKGTTFYVSLPLVEEE